MQLTIDSTEPLERVLPVVAALYGVELSVAAPPAAVSERPAAQAAVEAGPGGGAELGPRQRPRGQGPRMGTGRGHQRLPRELRQAPTTSWVGYSCPPWAATVAAIQVCACAVSTR